MLFDIQQEKPRWHFRTTRIDRYSMNIRLFVNYFTKISIVLFSLKESNIISNEYGISVAIRQALKIY